MIEDFVPIVIGIRFKRLIINKIIAFVAETYQVFKTC